MDTAQILEDLDKHAAEYNFPVLDNAYVEFGAARLSAFRADRDWLIAFEVLGFSTREVAFVDDLYAYGSCIAKGGFIGEELPLDQAKENPIFDSETNECIADWSRWAINVCGNTMSFSPSAEEYAQAGLRINRAPGGGSLREIELLRFLIHRLGAESLFMSDQVLLNRFPLCKNPVKLLQTTQWQHPDVADGEKPSSNVSIRSLVVALSQQDRSLFSQGHPNTHWTSWIQPA
jgi:hypothetical protein